MQAKKRLPFRDSLFHYTIIGTLLFYPGVLHHPPGVSLLVENIHPAKNNVDPAEDAQYDKACNNNIHFIYFFMVDDRFPSLTGQWMTRTARTVMP
jgi:hypothetical protein